MDIDTQAAIRRINGTPEEAEQQLADSMNLAANVIGAYAIRFGMNTEFIPDMATTIEEAARNFKVLNR